MDIARRRVRREPPTLTARPFCMRCRRPRSVCWCSELTSIETATRVVILQHPRERDNAIGTARMASLCLPQASLHVGVSWEGSDALALATADPARPPILLYPGPGARDILVDPPRTPVTLVVVDGTWSQAKTIVRENPVLRALPRYAFRTPEPTIYRIRREPSAEYVSTIEALMHVLGVLEGDPERFRALLRPMHSMVETQIERHALGASPRRRNPRPRREAASRLPAAIATRHDDLVCVAAEANAWPRTSAGRAFPDELVHWVARRPSSGEEFETVAAPSNPVGPRTVAHTGLDETRLAGGIARAELFAAFAKFVRPTDVIASWGTYATRLFELEGGRLPRERLDLRLAARRASGPGRGVGTLDDYARRVAPGESATELVRGRAVRRVEMLVRVVEAWRSAPEQGLGVREATAPRGRFTDVQ